VAINSIFLLRSKNFTFSGDFKNQSAAKIAGTNGKENAEVAVDWAADDSGPLQQNPSSYISL
jgi:hypothetical protein